jgi:Aerobic-type carbon monoxide dehydrogenase, small subunit CoxS/CutS homologs
LQDAFCETHGMQCGYCTPAMILAAHALLSKNTAPTREEIVDAISGNICRCTGYAQIVKPSRSPPSGCAARTSRRMSRERAGQISLHLVRSPGSRGPPLRGRQGQLRADIVPQGVKHVALVTVRIRPRALFPSTSRRPGDARRALRAGGCELAGATNALRPVSIRRTCRVIRWR